MSSREQWDPPAFLFLKILIEIAHNQEKCRLNIKVWALDESELPLAALYALC